MSTRSWSAKDAPLSMNLPRLEIITESIKTIIHEVQYKGAEIGVGFPGVVSDYEVINGPNMGDDIRHGSLIESLSENGFSCTLLNDADSALYHVIRNYKKYSGTETTLLITIGTSLGTAVSQRGRLLRNVELGRLLNEDGVRNDQTASARARRRTARTLEVGRESLIGHHENSLTRNHSTRRRITEQPESWFGMVEGLG